VAALLVLDLDPAILGDFAVRIYIDPALRLTHDVLDDDALWPLLLTTIQAVPPHVRIKYDPSGTTKMLVESASGQRYTFEAAVSPWIITPDRIFEPLAMNVSEVPFSSSGFDFRIEGVESTGDLSIVSSQPRPWSSCSARSCPRLDSVSGALAFER
jgi:hypothetical protein